MLGPSFEARPNGACVLPEYREAIRDIVISPELMESSKLLSSMTHFSPRSTTPSNATSSTNITQAPLSLQFNDLVEKIMESLFFPPLVILKDRSNGMEMMKLVPYEATSYSVVFGNNTKEMSKTEQDTRVYYSKLFNHWKSVGKHNREFPKKDSPGKSKIGRLSRFFSASHNKTSMTNSSSKFSSPELTGNKLRRKDGPPYGWIVKVPEYDYEGCLFDDLVCFYKQIGHRFAPYLLNALFFLHSEQVDDLSSILGLLGDANRKCGARKRMAFANVMNRAADTFQKKQETLSLWRDGTEKDGKEIKLTRAIQRIHDFCVDFLDDYKERAYQSAFLQPSLYFFRAIRNTVQYGDVDVHGSNTYLALIEATVGIHIPRLVYWEDGLAGVIEFRETVFQEELQKIQNWENIGKTAEYLFGRSLYPYDVVRSVTTPLHHFIFDNVETVTDLAIAAIADPTSSQTRAAIARSHAPAYHNTALNRMQQRLDMMGGCVDEESNAKLRAQRRKYAEYLAVFTSYFKAEAILPRLITTIYATDSIVSDLQFLFDCYKSLNYHLGKYIDAAVPPPLNHSTAAGGIEFPSQPAGGRFVLSSNMEEIEDVRYWLWNDEEDRWNLSAVQELLHACGVTKPPGSKGRELVDDDKFPDIIEYNQTNSETKMDETSKDNDDDSIGDKGEKASDENTIVPDENTGVGEVRPSFMSRAFNAMGMVMFPSPKATKLPVSIPTETPDDNKKNKQVTDKSAKSHAAKKQVSRAKNVPIRYGYPVPHMLIENVATSVDSAINPSLNAINLLNDGNENWNKWIVPIQFTPSFEEDGAWIIYSFTKPIPVSGYAVCSANDLAHRDPVFWIVEGMLERSRDQWTLLHTFDNVNERFQSRNEWKTFPLTKNNDGGSHNNPLMVTAIRMKIFAVRHWIDGLQLGHFHVLQPPDNFATEELNRLSLNEETDTIFDHTLDMRLENLQRPSPPLKKVRAKKGGFFTGTRK